jgi:hypothetical protein
MLSKVLIETAGAWAPIVAGMLGALVVHGGSWVIKKLRANAKTAPLAGAAEVAEDTLVAAIKAIGASPNKNAAQAALRAAEAALSASQAQLAEAAKAEVDVLTSSSVPYVLAPGGGVVNMPAVGNAGWAHPEK